MGLQGLGLKAIHKIERATDLYVLRATVNNGNEHRYWFFTTDEHQHGWYDKKTGGWSLNDSLDEACHTSLCRDLFGETTRARDDTWGSVCHGLGTWSPPRWHVHG